MPAKPARAQADAAPPAARRRIVAYARRYFFAHGFRNVTMDDLAAELGMSKKTLYAHFASKQSLLEAAMVDKLGELQGELDRISSDEAAGFKTRLQRLLQCIQAQLAEIQPPFIRDMRRETPELFSKIEARRQALIQRHFGKLFNQGRRCGLIRNDVPPNLILEILLGSMHAILNPQKIEELGMTPKSAFMGIIKVVTEGAMTSDAKGE